MHQPTSADTLKEENLNIASSSGNIGPMSNTRETNFSSDTKVGNHGNTFGFGIKVDDENENVNTRTTESSRTGHIHQPVPFSEEHHRGLNVTSPTIKETLRHYASPQHVPAPVPFLPMAQMGSDERRQSESDCHEYVNSTQQPLPVVKTSRSGSEPFIHHAKTTKPPAVAPKKRSTSQNDIQNFADRPGYVPITGHDAIQEVCYDHPKPHLSAPLGHPSRCPPQMDATYDAPRGSTLPNYNSTSVVPQTTGFEFQGISASQMHTGLANDTYNVPRSVHPPDDTYNHPKSAGTPNPIDQLARVLENRVPSGSPTHHTRGVNQSNVNRALDFQAATYDSPQGNMPVASDTYDTPRGGMPIASDTYDTPRGGMPIASDTYDTPRGWMPVASDTYDTPRGGRPVASDTYDTPRGGRPVASDTYDAPRGGRPVASDTYDAPRGGRPVASDTYDAPRGGRPVASDTYDTPRGGGPVASDTYDAPRGGGPVASDMYDTPRNYPTDSSYDHPRSHPNTGSRLGEQYNIPKSYQDDNYMNMISASQLKGTSTARDMYLDRMMEELQEKQNAPIQEDHYSTPSHHMGAAINKPAGIYDVLSGSAPPGPPSGQSLNHPHSHHSGGFPRATQQYQY